MPTVNAVLPSRDETEVKEQVTTLIRAAAAVGAALEPGGFARAWLSDNTRVVVASEGDAFVGFAVVVFGRRWFDDNFTASVLLMNGPARGALLSYIVDMAKMLGAQRLFWEAEAGDMLDGLLTSQRMLEL